MVIKVIYILTFGYKRRLLGRLGKMGVQVTQTVTLPCMRLKKICTIKQTYCVKDI